jgi:Cof subfamily protein (haloacid dehalogenase superfamily)
MGKESLKKEKLQTERCLTMITCIATDMDGTLLNERQEISEVNKKAILEAKEKGIEVIVATGRSYEEARYVLEEAGITCDVICVNGAEVRNKQGEIMHQAGIPGEKAAQISKVLNGLGIYFEVYTNQGTYTENVEIGMEVIIDIFTTANPSVPEEKIRQSAKERFEEGGITFVEDYGQVFREEGQLVYKFLVFSFNEALLEKAKELLADVTDIAISSSGKENLEINSKDAQKGIALEKLAKQKGHSLENTMAVGDNFNDLSMMKVVGRPVSMGNAVEEVKDFCAYTTATNKEDGVGKAIRDAMHSSVK